jgi:predicted alpha/beta hydrolase
VRVDQSLSSPVPIGFAAEDGYVLQGVCRRHTDIDVRRPVVVVNPATSVCCDYYAGFADYLHRHGFDVVLYDYRGIGRSRPDSLKGFEAGWIDWGRLDFEAALRYVGREFPGQPIHVVGHSVGGVLVGMAASSSRVSRVFTMGAQYAYWRDYAAARRLGMLLKWHVVMPLVTALFGYFPGRRMGWLEDTPRGVVRDWTSRHPRFEDTWRRGARVLPAAERKELVERFSAMAGDALALSFSDDEFGTVAAVRRLLRYYRGSRRTHLHLTPEAIGAARVGHFAFFNRRFEHNLWTIALEWLRHGRLPGGAKGEAAVFAPEAAQPA